MTMVRHLTGRPLAAITMADQPSLSGACSTPNASPRSARRCATAGATPLPRTRLQRAKETRFRPCKPSLPPAGSKRPCPAIFS